MVVIASRCGTNVDRIEYLQVLQLHMITTWTELVIPKGQWYQTRIVTGFWLSKAANAKLLERPFQSPNLQQWKKVYCA